MPILRRCSVCVVVFNLSVVNPFWSTSQKVLRYCIISNKQRSGRLRHFLERAELWIFELLASCYLLSAEYSFCAHEKFGPGFKDSMISLSVRLVRISKILPEFSKAM